MTGPARPAHYPLPGPPDDRLSDSFVAAVSDTIAFHGFPPFDDDSPDFGRLYEALRAFLYGPRTPEASR